MESGPGTGAGSQHVVFVDVDAKDNTTGIMFPPPAFLSRDFLETLYNVLHGDGGLLVLNFACRSPSLYEATIGRIKDVFDAVFEVLVSKEDCNVVVFAIRSDQLPEGAEATIPTSVAGAEHFLAHSSGNDATSTIAASSPLLRYATEAINKFCDECVLTCPDIWLLQVALDICVGTRSPFWRLRVAHSDSGK